MSDIPYLGEAFALLTALFWASAVIFFKKSGDTVHPFALNLFKGVLAVALLAPTMWLMGEAFYRPVDWKVYAIMLASGVIGISLADSMFFKCLNLLGAGLTAIVDCLYAPSIILLSMIWLGEKLTWIQVAGTVMIVGAVLTATDPKGRGPVDRKSLFMGIFWGALGMVLQAISLVPIKPILEASPLLWTTELRLIGGTIGLIVIIALHPRRRAIMGSLKKRVGWKYTLPGSFLGAYMAMIAWLAGMKFTQASVASALNQTSNVWIFIFAGIFLKETINRQKTIGIALGIGGTFLVLFGDMGF